MVRVRIILSLALFTAFPCFAQTHFGNPVFLQQFVPRAITPNTNFFLAEYFEGTGYAWTESGDGASINPDFTPAPQGSQCLSFTNVSGFSYTYTNITAQTETWGKFIYRCVQTNLACIVTLSRISAGDDMKINLDTGITVSHGSVPFGPGATVIAPGTTYYIWFYWKEGTGADGIVQLYISTTNARPGVAELSGTTGGSSSSPTAFSVQAASGASAVFDAIELSNAGFPTP